MSTFLFLFLFLPPLLLRIRICAWGGILRVRVRVALEDELVTLPVLGDAHILKERVRKSEIIMALLAYIAHGSPPAARTISVPRGCGAPLPITAQVGIGFGIGFRNCDVWMRGEPLEEYN
jgi:hypothetical protein